MHENYPFRIVAVSNLLTLAIYFFGAAIIYRLSAVGLAAYLLYVAWIELRLMRGHCVNCYYFGKTCSFGRGRLSCLFFKKGDPREFNRMQITWKSMIPDMLVSFVPVAAGIVILFRKFDWTLLAMTAVLFLLTTAGNGFVRGKLACRYCKQRELGCPAERLFKK